MIDELESYGVDFKVIYIRWLVYFHCNKTRNMTFYFDLFQVLTSFENKIIDSSSPFGKKFVPKIPDQVLKSIEDKLVALRSSNQKQISLKIPD